MITGSPTSERLNTPIKSKRGDRSRRQATNRKVRVCVESVGKVSRYLTGYRERYAENAYGATEKKLMLTVIEAVSEPKPTKRAGKRIHKGPQTLNQGAVRSVPRYATKVAHGKATTKAKAPREAKPSVDRDGCARVRVSDPVKNRKNKHTVQPLPSQIGTFGKVSSANDWELHSIDLEKLTGKLFTAIAVCRNPVAHLKKTIEIPRVRNKAEAIVALKTIHRIKT
jgi:hypothetical protein